MPESQALQMSAPKIALLLFVPVVLVSGCATTGKYRVHNEATLKAERQLKRARSSRAAATDKIAFYLAAAETASAAFDAGPAAPTAREIYNSASAEVVPLLIRHPAAVIPAPEQGRQPYHLVWQGGGKGVWSPTFFYQYLPADKVKIRRLRVHNAVEGYGGALVGIRKTGHGWPSWLFKTDVGVTAPVTATLDFKPQKDAQRVSIVLNDPTKRQAAPVAGKPRPLAADFTAPLAYYPRRNELWAGLMGMIKVEEFLNNAGITLLTPYDPEKIPVVFVHGLASTPQMWLDVINEIELDPQLRGRCQYWMFAYSTGVPVVYSAMQLRENLETFRRLYPARHPYVLISHSMGGLLSRLQVTTSQRVIWDRLYGRRAEELYRSLPPNSLLKQTLITTAYPEVKRIVFICTPHRGSELALGSIGNLATRLISIPGTVLKTVENAVGGSLDLITGANGRVPTSIQSLSPNSPILLALKTLPIQATHHSIIGDRGRGDTPNSSDGVVPYWSSHLDSAESELIVPGPHGSYDLPQTIAELRRILRVHLRATPANRQGKARRG